MKSDAKTKSFARFAQWVYLFMLIGILISCKSRDSDHWQKGTLSGITVSKQVNIALVSVSTEGGSPLSRLMLDVPSSRQTRYRFKSIFEDLGFETSTLTDPTVQQYIDRLATIGKMVTRESNLLLLHSGHGWPLAACMRRGVFEPIDILSGLQRANVRFKKLIVIIDSCYSGGWAKEIVGNAEFRRFADEIVVMTSTSGSSPTAFGKIGSGFSFLFSETLYRFEGEKSVSFSDMVIKMRELLETKRAKIPFPLAADAVPYFSSFPSEAINGEFFQLKADLQRNNNDFRIWLKPFASWKICGKDLEANLKREIRVKDDASFIGYKVIRLMGSPVTNEEIAALNAVPCAMKVQQILASPPDFSDKIDNLEYVSFYEDVVTKCEGARELLSTAGIEVFENEKGIKIRSGQVRQSVLDKLQEVCPDF
jgi:hypothetical protein